MDYYKFILYLMQGYELGGYIDNNVDFKALNVKEGMVTICIRCNDDENKTKDIDYLDEEVLHKPIYDDLTFKELFNENRVTIYEIF